MKVAGVILVFRVKEMSDRLIDNWRQLIKIPDKNELKAAKEISAICIVQRYIDGIKQI